MFNVLRSRCSTPLEYKYARPSGYQTASSAAALRQYLSRRRRRAPRAGPAAAVLEDEAQPSRVRRFEATMRGLRPLHHDGQKSVAAVRDSIRHLVEIIAFVLNHRVVLHAIDATSARWRGDAGSSPLDRARTAASSPRNDLVKNCRVHPTHWLISTQDETHLLLRDHRRGSLLRERRASSDSSRRSPAPRAPYLYPGAPARGPAASSSSPPPSPSLRRATAAAACSGR